MNNPTQIPGAGAAANNNLSNIPLLPDAYVAIQCNQARQRKEAGDYMGMVNHLCNAKSTINGLEGNQRVDAEDVLISRLNTMFGPGTGGRRRGRKASRKAKRKGRKTRRR